MCEAQNAVNPDGFTSILTKLQHKMLVSKSDSSFNVFAKKITAAKDGEEN